MGNRSCKPDHPLAFFGEDKATGAAASNVSQPQGNRGRRSLSLLLRLDFYHRWLISG